MRERCLFSPSMNRNRDIPMKLVSRLLNSTVAIAFAEDSPLPNKDQVLEDVYTRMAVAQ